MTKGFALNDERFINGNKYDAKYFDELLERIKTIRVSERMAYQKITDIFIATATDYNPKSEEAYTFFKIVQNKLHYAISGYTAAELIFKRANEKRERKATTLNLIADDLREIRKVTYCAECGGKAYRKTNGKGREYWNCENPDCFKFEYRMTDQMILGAVITVLNSAAANPSLIECGGEVSTYVPTADVIRQQNEVNQMIDSTQTDFERIKSEIFKLAEMKYDCCTYNDNPQKTDKLKVLLENHEQLNTLDIGLFKACVSRIWISHFCTIEVEFVNRVIIKNITERNERNEHSAECNDNSCKSPDSGKS